jgi:hypothetical protein
MWALRCFIPQLGKNSDAPKENTHQNMLQQIVLRECFFSVGFVPDTLTPKGNPNWDKYNKIAYSAEAMEFYNSVLEFVPHFMRGGYMYTDSENGLHPVALHYFMTKGVFASVMTDDGLWGWADSKELHFDKHMAEDYKDYCEEHVPLLFIPLTPTKRQRAVLDFHVAKVRESLKPDGTAVNNLPLFEINCLVSYGEKRSRREEV